MSEVTLPALLLVLGYAVAHNGGVAFPEWNWCLIAIGAITAIHFTFRKPTVRLRLDPITLWTLIVIGLCTVLQVIPLPINLVRVLSPQRFELSAKASEVFTIPSYVTLSIVPWITTQYILNVVGYIAVFVVVRDLASQFRPKHPWAIIWPLLIVGGLEALLGWIQFASNNNANSSVVGTYANRNHYAGLLEMILPFTIVYGIAILYRGKSVDSRFLSRGLLTAPAFGVSALLVVAVMMLVAIIYSLSRMGFLASVASIALVSFITVSVLWQRSDDHLSRWRKFLPLVSVTTTLLLGFIYLPSDPLAERFADLAATNDISADSRAQIWRDSYAMISTFPLLGCGLGGYESCFLRYKTVAPMFTVAYAHNDYLQIFGELGVVGTLAGLTLVIWLIYKAVKYGIYGMSSDQQFLVVGCIAGMVAMLLHSFVDFNMYVPANALVFSWICGLIDSGPNIMIPA